MKVLKHLLLTSLLTSATSGWAAGEVALNGIACLPGKRYAMFEVSQSVTSQKAIMLAEGETLNGLTLISVDAGAGRVEVEQDGVRQSLRIGSASGGPLPSLLQLVESVRARYEYIPKRSNNLTDAQNDLAEQYQIMAGNPGFGTIPAKTPDNSRSVEKSPDTAAKATDNDFKSVDGSPDTVPTDSTKATTDKTQEYWYKESTRIEARRIASAADVLAGEMDPWPRTPLTPPITPSSLVRREFYFSNHSATGLVPGYLD